MPWVISRIERTWRVSSSMRLSFSLISFVCRHSSCSLACRSNLICSRSSVKRRIDVSWFCWRRVYRETRNVPFPLAAIIVDLLLYCLSLFQLRRRRSSIGWICSCKQPAIVASSAFSKYIPFIVFSSIPDLTHHRSPWKTHDHSHHHRIRIRCPTVGRIDEEGTRRSSHGYWH